MSKTKDKNKKNRKMGRHNIEEEKMSKQKDESQDETQEENSEQIENKGENGPMEQVNLPKWDLHNRINVRGADESVFDRITREIDDGYIVVKFDKTYLLVVRDSYICEVGALEDAQRISTSFLDAGLEEIEEQIERSEEGAISVYRLDPKACEILCDVVNEKPRYGNLDTHIVDVEKMVDKLSNDEFTGLITFTDQNTFAYIRFFEGGFEDFWYEGIEKIDSINEFLEAKGREKKLEINVVSDVEKREIESGEQSVNYTSLAEGIADSVADVTGRKHFYDTLSENIEIIEGARVEDQKLIVEDESAKDPVFHALYDTIEESAKLVPIWKILDEIEDRLRRIEGGEEFLDVYDSDVDGRLV